MIAAQPMPATSANQPSTSSSQQADQLPNWLKPAESFNADLANYGIDSEHERMVTDLHELIGDPNPLDPNFYDTIQAVKNYFSEQITQLSGKIERCTEAEKAIVEAMDAAVPGLSTQLASIPDGSSLKEYLNFVGGNIETSPHLNATLHAHRRTVNTFAENRTLLLLLLSMYLDQLITNFGKELKSLLAGSSLDVTACGTFGENSDSQAHPLLMNRPLGDCAIQDKYLPVAYSEDQRKHLAAANNQYLANQAALNPVREVLNELDGLTTETNSIIKQFRDSGFAIGLLDVLLQWKAGELTDNDLEELRSMWNME
ncbi:hypothetical protein IWQ60_007277 [Tieghemiomyces parasiticus]|uniref:Uncharacterized protein n=1 Tax=Tieghemiomyces parasiticus TaxID=78921 RepID=A0A9W8DV88_9FUNG|nr:hypothetical protein IWQ60_007277 [Tieghemiomyces parasiticus]